MDMTPMIDITFLMLIFFLVASIPDIQTAVELPPARHGVGVRQDTAMVITLGDSGKERASVYLADGKIDSEILPSGLEAQREMILASVQESVAQNNTNIVIKADRNVKHRDVARVIKSVSNADGVNIFLAVLEID